MYARGQARAAEVQIENKNQPPLATAAEIAKLRQVVQQDELTQKQEEEARKREEELTRRQNNLFKVFKQRFLIQQGEDRTGPAAEQVELEVRVQPTQPQ